MAAGLAALVTLLVAVLPALDFAYRAPALHTLLETASSVVALLIGFLVYGRFRRSGRLQELLLVCSLLAFAVANLLLTAIPTALQLGGETEVTRWAPLVVRFTGTLLLAAAALCPRRVVLRDLRAGPLVVLLAVVLTALAVLSLLLGERLPPPVDPIEVPGSSDRPRLTGHPAALTVQAVSVLLYAVAALAFTRAAARGDELLRWLGAACAVNAFARVNYLLFPSLYSEFVYVGDLLRFAYYLLLLVGATREISSYWAAQSHAAVLEDRRRLARDLHDGLTQELTYIRSQAHRLANRQAPGPEVERIAAAAERALDEARTAIVALSRTSDEPFAVVLRRTAEGLASRYDAAAVVHVDDGLQLVGADAEAVLRIVGEALRNAIRHGRATRVVVELSAPLTLSITDDGQGFDPSPSNNTPGFGLTSMRERAEALGATFTIDSAPGRGTTVRVQRS